MAMAEPTQEPSIEWSDVQGMVLRGYGKHPYSAILLMRIDDGAGARAWLQDLANRVTTALEAHHRSTDVALNVAFTRSGLERLGFSSQQLATFPTSFLEGMASATRARILGDEQDSAPAHWAWGSPTTAVDAILLIFAKTREAVDATVKAEQGAFRGVSVTYGPVETQLWPDEKEHFGFRDGVSQPIIEGSPTRPNARPPAADAPFSPSNVIKAGEFLLGYNNEYGVLPDPLNLPIESDPHGLLATVELPQGVTQPDLGRNGTYLVVRQVAQDVPKLWNYLDEMTKDTSGQTSAGERDRLGAKLIGRWPGGAPVALSPDHDDPELAEQNEFVYKAIDPEGFGCPFGAHTRRANPRDGLGDDPGEALKLTKRHRIIRRGRSYGPRANDPLDRTDTRERGLIFICINANIERQFEFIQQTWINNPTFNGLYGERDPIFGNSGATSTGTMTIPRHPVRRVLHGLGGFVTVRGGAYFFLPGIRALRFLGSPQGA
jgi:Dyp-type peroxidase family